MVNHSYCTSTSIFKRGAGLSGKCTGQWSHHINELHILWSELSRHKLSLMLATAHCSSPDNDIGLIAQCELSRYVKWD